MSNIVNNFLFPLESLLLIDWGSSNYETSCTEIKIYRKCLAKVSNILYNFLDFYNHLMIRLKEKTK